MKIAHIAGMLLAVISFGAIAQTEAQNAAEVGSPRVFGEIRVLTPATNNWVYNSVRAQLTSLDLGSAGWYSTVDRWESRRAPDGTVWLIRTNGLYIDYAIPLPGGMY